MLVTKHKKALVLLFSIAVSITGIFFFKKQVPTEAKTLQIGDSIVTIEVADTLQSRAQGLSGRVSLPPNHGMLFIFDSPARHSFWMNDMHFPLDFVWIENGIVVDLDQNVPVLDATGTTTILEPNVPVTMVLELPAGTIEAETISIGDDVSL